AAIGEELSGIAECRLRLGDGMKRILAVLAFLLSVPLVAFAHGGHKHVMGTVSDLTAEQIVVKAKDGDASSVPLTANTKYYFGAKTDHAANADDVKVGMRVVVHLDGEGKAIEVHIPEK